MLFVGRVVFRKNGRCLCSVILMCVLLLLMFSCYCIVYSCLFCVCLRCVLFLCYFDVVWCVCVVVFCFNVLYIVRLCCLLCVFLLRLLCLCDSLYEMRYCCVSVSAS